MSLKNTYKFVFGMCGTIRKRIGIRAQEDEEQIQNNHRRTQDLRGSSN